MHLLQFGIIVYWLCTNIGCQVAIPPAGLHEFHSFRGFLNNLCLICVPYCSRISHLLSVVLLYFFLPAMPKGMPNPVPAHSLVCITRETPRGVPTHEQPVSQPEKSCLGVEWQTVVRSLFVVVGAEGVHAACG